MPMYLTLQKKQLDSNHLRGNQNASKAVSLQDNRPQSIVQANGKSMEYDKLLLNRQDELNNMQQRVGSQAAFLVDNRPNIVAQKKQTGTEKKQPVSYIPVQKKPNQTGLPDNLKSGIENLSGCSMDDVKVNYNSAEPAQLQAHAYAKGNQIHLAPGQEKHLPHEAWHVVQQRQGRVRPTLQMKGGVNINDNKSLEKEADVMGETAQRYFDPAYASSQKINYSSSLNSIVQRVEINAKTVSSEVLKAFSGLNHWVKLLFTIAPEIPGFFDMSDEKKIQYFQGMNMAMPMLQQMIQVQQGVLMIGHQTVSPDQNMGSFITLNPTFIQESISLFNGGGASLSFPNPKGTKTISIVSLRALMPSKPSPMGSPDTGRAPVPRLALMPPKPAVAATHASLPAEADWAALLRAKDREEEMSVRPLLMTLLKRDGVSVPENIDFRQLEIIHATHLYQKEKTSLGKKPSMKSYKPDYGAGITQIDKMRQAQLLLGPQKATDGLLAPLMPRLVALSHFIRLTNYFDSASERLIRDSGRLQSKQRRRLKAPAAHVVSKSSVTDNQLGNTDHVFFFAEYEDHHAPAKFRKTRFTGQANEEHTVLSKRPDLDGSERRVSFPLNSMDPRGMHGYVEDIGSEGINPVEKIFSGTPPVRGQIHPEGQKEFKEERKESKKPVKASAVPSSAAAIPGAAAAAVGSRNEPGAAAVSSSLPHNEVAPPPGVHLLMDLLRQRFKKANFPPSIQNKGEGEMVADLLKMTDPELYTFLFRKHPRAKAAKEINPQILVPGSVSFSTPGARFDKPLPKELERD